MTQVSVGMDPNLISTSSNMQAGVARNFNSVFIEKQRITKEPHDTREKPTVNNSKSNSILIACSDLR